MTMHPRACEQPQAIHSVSIKVKTQTQICLRWSWRVFAFIIVMKSVNLKTQITPKVISENCPLGPGCQKAQWRLWPH